MPVEFVEVAVHGQGFSYPHVSKDSQGHRCDTTGTQTARAQYDAFPAHPRSYGFRIIDLSDCAHACCLTLCRGELPGVPARNCASPGPRYSANHSAVQVLPERRTTAHQTYPSQSPEPPFASG